MTVHWVRYTCNSATSIRVGESGPPGPVALLSVRPEVSLRELHRQRPLPCIGGGVEPLGPTDHRFELGERKSSA